MEGYKYIILHFSRKVGHTKTRIPHPEKTVRGNLVLTVTSDFIDRFNVPKSLNIFPLISEVKEFQFVNKNGRTIRRGFVRKLKPRKGEKLVEIRKLRPSASNLAPQFAIERHYLRFPDFFNRWMIDNALYEICSQSPDFERLRFYINGGRMFEIIGEQTGYGAVSIESNLRDGDTPHHSRWGEVTLIAPMGGKKKQLTLF